MYNRARPDIAELELAELEAILAEAGHERFHARQLFRWIYRRGVTDFERMTDLGRALRADLARTFTIGTPAVVRCRSSSANGPVP